MFPQTCPLCLAPDTGGGVCTACLAELPMMEHGCRVCLEPLSSGAGALCGSCLKKPPPYERVLAVCRYAPLMDELIRQLKYHGRIELSRPLGELLAQRVATEAALDETPLPDHVIPVPLHRRRIRERGFNQAVEIARVAAARLGVGCDVSCVVKKRETPPQTALSARLRAGNLKGAFASRHGLNGKHIAIIDDVMTTGTTILEVARLLKKAKAGRIEAWVVARR